MDELRKIDYLIQLAGGQVLLADLLGVSQSSVHRWKRYGQISKMGALLVERSPLLSLYFTAHDLRPDLTWADKQRWTCHLKYMRCCKQQDQNLPVTAKLSPLWYPKDNQ